jgi:protein PhnA
MSDFPSCAKCGSEYTYEDRDMFVCPECGHEWPKDGVAEKEETAKVIRDAHGNELQDGDSVTVIKDLKVKAAMNFKTAIP